MNATVGQPINCTVSARRFGSEGYGMMLAEVGLPPGADVDRVSLGKLLDNWTISRYELQPDRIVFYLWSSAAQGDKFSFRFTPRYSIRAKAAPAKLVDYYNPDLNAVIAPQTSTWAQYLINRYYYPSRGCASRLNWGCVCRTEEMDLDTWNHSVDAPCPVHKIRLHV